MNPDTDEHKRRVNVVLSTWAEAVKAVPQWHELFFTELSHREPKVFGLYSFDIGQMSQNPLYKAHVKLLQTTLENALAKMENNYEATIPDLFALGERHYTYGVEVSHVLLLVEVFIWLLTASFSTDWTPDQEECWRYCLGLVGSPLVAGIASAKKKTAKHNARKKAAVKGEEGESQGESETSQQAINPALAVESVDLTINGNVCQVSVV